MHLKAKRRPYVAARAGKRDVNSDVQRSENGASCSTNLIDAEWELISDRFEHDAAKRGAPPRYSRRDLVNAHRYVLRTGCSSRPLPNSFAPWQAVYKAFTGWVEAGKFEQMQDRLRGQWRPRMGRSAHPSAAEIDARSTRASPQGSESGFDAGKKIKSKKHHLIVDIVDILAAVTITTASVQGRDAAAAVVEPACQKAPRIEKLHTDDAYGGSSVKALEQTHGILVAVVRRPGNGAAATLHDAKRSPEIHSLSPANLMSCPSAGLWNVLTHGRNVGALQSRITTVKRQSPWRACGSSMRVSCSIDWLELVLFRPRPLSRFQKHRPRFFTIIPRINFFHAIPFLKIHSTFSCGNTRHLVTAE